MKTLSAATPTELCELTDSMTTAALNTLESIEAAKGMNAKKAALENGKDNPVLFELLRATYHPYNQYGIRKMPNIVPNMDTKSNSDCYHDFINLLAMLSNRTLTGNGALHAVSELFSRMPALALKWLTRVLLRDLRCGISVTTINKVLPDCVPVYACSLANKIAPEDLNLNTANAMKVLPRHIVYQYKIDGYRCQIFKYMDGDKLVCYMCSRSGKLIEGYDELMDEVMRLLPVGYVYDGEITSIDLYDWIAENTKNGGVSAANRDLFTVAMSDRGRKTTGKQGIFNLFDMVPITTWQEQGQSLPYSTRMDIIDMKVKPLRRKYIMVVPHSGVLDRDNPEDRQKIVDAFYSFINIGWEGLMIKDADAPYCFGRDNSMLKMKKMDTIDLEVIELQEGNGRLRGMMGAAVVSFNGGTVNVGSGWSDEQRRFYWEHKNELLGHTIEIAYQAVTHDANGKYSLSFPVVKCVRDDK